MATILVHIALVAYTAGAAAFLTWLVRPAPGFARAGRLLLLVGVVVHFAAFGVSLGVAGAGLGVKAWKGGELFSLLAAVTVAGYLLLDFRYELSVAGAFVGPFTVAIMVPAHLVHSDARAIAPEVSHSIALFVHVGASAIGTAVLALSFGLSVLYLASERQMKEKRPGRLFARLPSLDLLDRAGYRLAVWGFVFLSLAIATGSLVSTCNRIEIFAVADSRAAGEDVLETLGSVAAPHAVCRFEEEALRHLFRVAASLDSMVVGEAQILGQVKEAAAIAQQAGALGPELSKALARATTAAKRVRTETGIARGAVSLSSVAVQLAHKLSAASMGGPCCS